MSTTEARTSLFPATVARGPGRFPAAVGLLMIAVALVAGGCSNQPSDASPPSSAAASPPGAGAPVGSDAAFLAGMVPHHAAAVSMAQAELQRGTNPQARQLAQSIMTDQQREITEMTQLDQQLFGRTPSPTRMAPMGELMGLPLSMNMSSMGSDVAKAPNPDRAFLSMMLPHHASAIVMADEQTRSGTNPQVTTLARSIVTAQAREIGQMQAMLDAGI